jgi:hypothetical protein
VDIGGAEVAGVNVSGGIKDGREEVEEGLVSQHMEMLPSSCCGITHCIATTACHGLGVAQCLSMLLPLRGSQSGLTAGQSSRIHSGSMWGQGCWCWSSSTVAGGEATDGRGLLFLLSSQASLLFLSRSCQVFSLRARRSSWWDLQLKVSFSFCS